MDIQRGADLAWSLFLELRKEVLESQKLRAQIIGFKITFVTTTIALIVANIERVPAVVLVVPALAAVFFDLLITSYSFSIKRIGAYVRNELEPHLSSSGTIPPGLVLWETYLDSPKLKQSFSLWGNAGLTFLALLLGIFGTVLSPPEVLPSGARAILLLLMASFGIVDVWALMQPRRFFGFRHGAKRVVPIP